MYKFAITHRTPENVLHASFKILFASANVHLQLTLCKKGLVEQMDIFFNDVKSILKNECKNRENPRKCVKYFRTLIEKGKDVEKIFKFQK